jgi:ABC-type ATPase involved in cell division
MVPSSGSLEYKGRNIRDLSPGELKTARANIGFIPETPVFLDSANIYDNIEYVLRLLSVPEKIIFDRIAHVLKLTGLMWAREVLPSQLCRTEKKLLSLAMALVREIDMLVCDINLGGFEDEAEIVNILKGTCARGGGVVLTARENVELDFGGARYADIINGRLK